MDYQSFVKGKSKFLSKYVLNVKTITASLIGLNLDVEYAQKLPS